MQVGGVYVQDCVNTGLPPVQPDGEDEITDLVFVPLDWQVDQSEYAHEVQTGGT